MLSCLSKYGQNIYRSLAESNNLKSNKNKIEDENSDSVERSTKYISNKNMNFNIIIFIVIRDYYDNNVNDDHHHYYDDYCWSFGLNFDFFFHRIYWCLLN